MLIGMLALFNAARADGLRAGQWKILTRPEIDGVAGPEQETTRCLTESDVSNLEATFSPNSRAVNSSCESVGQETSPRRLTWHLRCSGQIDMDVAGEFLFPTPDHYSAIITSHASMLGRPLQDSRALIDGRHLGPCQ